jgi:hypothetical protein
MVNQASDQRADITSRPGVCHSGPFSIGKVNVRALF